MTYNSKLSAEEQEQYTYENSAEARRVLVVDESGAAINMAGLVPENYDYVSLGYTGDNLTTVVYKTGGVGGTTVATLTLAYTGSQLDTITKT